MVFHVFNHHLSLLLSLLVENNRIKSKLLPNCLTIQLHLPILLLLLPILFLHIICSQPRQFFIVFDKNTWRRIEVDVGFIIVNDFEQAHIESIFE